MHKLEFIKIVELETKVCVELDINKINKNAKVETGFCFLLKEYY